MSLSRKLKTQVTYLYPLLNPETTSTSPVLGLTTHAEVRSSPMRPSSERPTARYLGWIKNKGTLISITSDFNHAVNHLESLLVFKGRKVLRAQTRWLAVGGRVKDARRDGTG